MTNLDENELRRHPIVWIYHDKTDNCPVKFDDYCVYEEEDWIDVNKIKMNPGSSIDWTRVVRYRVLIQDYQIPALDAKRERSCG